MRVISWIEATIELSDIVLRIVAALSNVWELILRHLHELSLVLNLSLGQLKCFIGHSVARRGDNLGHVLARHQEILLRLLVLEVAMRRRRILQVMALIQLVCLIGACILHIVILELSVLVSTIGKLMRHTAAILTRWSVFYTLITVITTLTIWCLIAIAYVLSGCLATLKWVNPTHMVTLARDIWRVGCDKARVVVICRATKVQVAVSCQLWDSLGLARLTLCNYHRWKVGVWARWSLMISLLFGRGFVVRIGAVVAACLVTRRLVDLALEQLILFLVVNV